MPVYDDLFETYQTLVEELDKIGILYIHVIETSAREHEKGEELLRIMREKFRNLVIVNGGYDREKAEEAIEANRAELVAFGTPFISNPDLPRRLKEEIPLTPPDNKTFYSSGKKGYTDYDFS